MQSSAFCEQLCIPREFVKNGNCLQLQLRVVALSVEANRRLTAKNLKRKTVKGDVKGILKTMTYSWESGGPYIYIAQCTCPGKA